MVVGGLLAPFGERSLLTRLCLCTHSQVTGRVGVPQDGDRKAPLTSWRRFGRSRGRPRAASARARDRRRRQPPFGRFARRFRARVALRTAHRRCRPHRRGKSGVCALASCAASPPWLSALHVQTLAARLEALESGLAAPLHALTAKLADLEKAVANHGLGGSLKGSSNDLRDTLNAVKALAMQVCPSLRRRASQGLTLLSLPPSTRRRTGRYRPRINGVRVAEDLGCN